MGHMRRLGRDDVVGISSGKAAAWAKLAARDWSDYVANRTARR